MDESTKKELTAINTRIETMLDIVLEHFGDSEDRFNDIEDKLKGLKADWEAVDDA